MVQGKFYAVARGRKTGVFREWVHAEAQVLGYPGSKHKSFPTNEAAEMWLLEVGVKQLAVQGEQEPEHFVVVVGKHPGIYADRDAAKRETEGVTCADMIVSASYQDAEAYLNQFGLQFNPPTADTTGYCSWVASVIADHPDLDSSMVAFCDGSLPGNGERTDGKIACVFPLKSNLNVDKFDTEATTSNRAEYIAGIAALEQADKADPDRQIRIVIFTSSLLLVNSMTKDVDKWRRSGWKTSKSQPVENQDLLESLISLSDRRTVEWRHVPKENGESSWAWHWSHLTEGKARFRPDSAVAA